MTRAVLRQLVRVSASPRISDTVMRGLRLAVGILEHDLHAAAPRQHLLFAEVRDVLAVEQDAAGGRREQAQQRRWWSCPSLTRRPGRRWCCAASQVTPSTALTMGALRDCEVREMDLQFLDAHQRIGGADDGLARAAAAAGSRAGVAGISFWGGRSAESP